MSGIDWSKAPEGAEFWNPNSELFYRSLDGEFQKFSETRGRWAIAAGERHEYQTLIAKPAPWNGEGLPPVGTVCEYRVGNGTWYPCTIRYVTTPISDEEVQVIINCPHLNGDQIGGVGNGIGEINFRQTRTPEQIAAEIECATIKQICDDLDVPIAIARRAFEKGYRKFEIINEPKS